MSDRFYSENKETSINLQKSGGTHTVKYLMKNGLKKHRNGLRRSRDIILGVLFLLLLCGFVVETCLLIRMENYRSMENGVASQEKSILKKLIKKNKKKIADLESSLMEQLSETDDPSTANHKLLRKVRALSTTVGNCQVSDKGGKCNYTESIAFFYTSHHVLRESGNFSLDSSPAASYFQCEKQMVDTLTGQIWCKNEHGRADDFYNRFPLLDQTINPDELPWPYLNQSAFMLKPGTDWTDLTHHMYYGLKERTKIMIKQSGIYMLFASVNFNVYKGASVSYGIRKNSSVLKSCRLPQQAGRHDSRQLESCFIFLVSYLNRGDYLTMTISAGTNFILGETNFYIGLYHLTSMEINTNSSN